MKKYIYAIIRKPNQFQISRFGMDKEPVYLIESKNLGVVVSDAKRDSYEVDAENILSHEQIVEEVMKEYAPVLPVSFGTIAENEKAVKDIFLKDREQEFFELLKELENKEERELRAMWLSFEEAMRNLAIHDPEIQSVSQEVKDTRATLNEEIEIGRWTAQRLKRRKEAIKKDVLDHLAPLSHAWKDKAVYGEEFIFNLSFLITRENIDRFEKNVEEIDRKYSADNIFFRYSGPLPPYDFVDFSRG